MKAKDILYDILHAHCLTTQNTNKVLKLAGIPTNIYNGNRDYWRIRKIILRIISEDKAKEIINIMPFPFIEANWREQEKHKNWLKKLFPVIPEYDTFIFYSRNVLCPLPEIVGYRMENSTGYAEVITKR